MQCVCVSRICELHLHPIQNEIQDLGNAVTQVSSFVLYAIGGGGGGGGGGEEGPNPLQRCLWISKVTKYMA